MSLRRECKRRVEVMVGQAAAERQAPCKPVGQKTLKNLENVNTRRQLLDLAIFGM